MSNASSATTELPQNAVVFIEQVGFEHAKPESVAITDLTSHQAETRSLELFADLLRVHVGPLAPDRSYELALLGKQYELEVGATEDHVAPEFGGITSIDAQVENENPCTAPHVGLTVGYDRAEDASGIAAYALYEVTPGGSAQLLHSELAGEQRAFYVAAAAGEHCYDIEAIDHANNVARSDAVCLLVSGEMGCSCSSTGAGPQSESGRRSDARDVAWSVVLGLAACTLRVRRRVSAVCAVVLGLSTACGGGAELEACRDCGGGPVTKIEPQLPRISIGKSIMLTAWAGDGTMREVAWSTAEPEIATVDPFGLLTGVSVGETELRAQVESMLLTTTVQVGVRFRALAVGRSFTCALAEQSDDYYCWLLGEEPRRITSAPPLVSIASSGQRGCGLTHEGTIWCREPSELGREVELAAPAPLASIAVSDTRACGLSATGEAYCWSFADDALARPVDTSLRFTQITAGFEHACAIGEDHHAYCWGGNTFGQLGTGAGETTYTDQPTPLAGGLEVAEIRAGDYHTCARTSEGVAYCWGYNAINNWPKVPTQIPGDDRFSALDSRGQMSFGLNEERKIVSLIVPALRSAMRFSSIAAGFFDSCGLGEDWLAYCWSNAGAEEHGSLDGPHLVDRQ